MVDVLEALHARTYSQNPGQQAGLFVAHHTVQHLPNIRFGNFLYNFSAVFFEGLDDSCLQRFKRSVGSFEEIQDVLDLTAVRSNVLQSQACRIQNHDVARLEEVIFDD